MNQIDQINPDILFMFWIKQNYKNSKDIFSGENLEEDKRIKFGQIIMNVTIH